jgi:16S rRNA (cytidine1402-2'-O)-methyltransferase
MTGDQGFVFRGFLPSKSGERQQAVQALSQESRAVVLLEAPHRIEALAQALSVLGERRITVGRELTKQFEQIETLAAQDLPAWLAEKPDRQRGEFVLVLHDAPVAASAGEGLRVLQVLLPELPLKTAVKLAAEITGESKNELYDKALALKNG